MQSKKIIYCGTLMEHRFRGGKKNPIEKKSFYEWGVVAYCTPHLPGGGENDTT